MADDVIDAGVAQMLHIYAARTYSMVSWVVTHDAPEYPGKFVARLVTDIPSPYVLAADTLAEVQEQLPPGLVHSERQPADPPEVVEIWFAG